MNKLWKRDGKSKRGQVFMFTCYECGYLLFEKSDKCFNVSHQLWRHRCFIERQPKGTQVNPFTSLNEAKAYFNSSEVIRMEEQLPLDERVKLVWIKIGDKFVSHVYIPRLQPPDEYVH